MTTEKCRYFLAIVPPAPFFEKADEIKHYFNKHYNCKASLNSPPHVTLHMPFEWRGDRENDLILDLQKFSADRREKIYITFNNFGCFAPRVIFISVVNTPELTFLQNKLRQFCKKELGLFNADYKDLPFHPHLTVAFRDLKKQVFPNAWEEFSMKSFEGQFTCTEISLLKHVEKKWGVIKNLSLGD